VDGVLPYGTVTERIEAGAEYKDSKGRKPVPYARVLEKMKISQDTVMSYASEQGIELPESVFEMPEASPKKEKAVASGRPKKAGKSVIVDESEDLFAGLVQNSLSESVAVDESAEKELAAQEKAVKAAEEKAAAELKVAEEKAAAEAKATADAAAAAALAAKKITPEVSLYSISPKLTLSTYDLAYLKKYLSTLKKTATVTCIGYTYTQKTSLAKATVLAKQQANAVCSIVKKLKPTLKTSILIRPATSAPKAAVGAKWVAISYRVDGFQPKK
jgi:hypothetical protein